MQSQSWIMMKLLLEPMEGGNFRKLFEKIKNLLCCSICRYLSMFWLRQKVRIAFAASVGYIPFSARGYYADVVALVGGRCCVVKVTTASSESPSLPWSVVVLIPLQHELEAGGGDDTLWLNSFSSKSIRYKWMNNIKKLKGLLIQLT